MGSTRAAPGPGEQATPYVTSRFYRPPELLCGSSHYGPAVDVWSLACAFARVRQTAPPCCTAPTRPPALV